MGLGAQKRRTKLSSDPNNTQWAKSTNTFGHKILSAQGWKPGDYLGAENANHADHYTGANASHIKVLLREENLGLGVQVGKVNAETFGLSLFSGVLGRLNGKSVAEIQKHQSALRDAELRTYHAQKYGHMNFVRGGFLVGDRIEKSKSPGQISGNEDVVVGKSKSKKRGSDDGPDNLASKKIKRRKTNANEPSMTNAEERTRLSPGADDDVALQKVSKKTEKKKKKDREAAEEDAKEDKTPNGTAEGDRSQRKQERRARKEERRKRKEEKRLAASNSKLIRVKSKDVQADVDKKPSTSTQRVDMFAGNRHAVRQRYIQQKRMASMDPQAMKEIFMLKPTITAA